ncbi:HAD family acid phosphatase [Streptomyces sp. MMS24-I31]|uniref:HAD family acid phosphatase n=1 Tax=Streptomyces sp. MMS24-I31 TaxID=3351563 RepID=UPI003896A409
MLKKVTMITGGVLCVAVLASTAHASSSTPGKSQWESDVKQVAKPLGDYVRNRLGEAKDGDHLALVLDIDNTSIATHYDPGKPVEPILDVAEYAHEHHASILFATNRMSSDRDDTLKQLKNAGYTVDGLCMRTDKDDSKADVKLGCRKHFEGKGYTLVANIGNRDTDFKGGHYEKGFKLPDYDGALS